MKNPVVPGIDLEKIKPTLSQKVAQKVFNCGLKMIDFFGAL